MIMSNPINERIKFRLIHTSCCGALLCWVNPRLPNFCPECGHSIFPQVRADVVFIDDEATLRYTANRSVLNAL